MWVHEARRETNRAHYGETEQARVMRREQNSVKSLPAAWRGPDSSLLSVLVVYCRVVDDGMKLSKAAITLLNGQLVGW